MIDNHSDCLEDLRSAVKQIRQELLDLTKAVKDNDDDLKRKLMELDKTVVQQDCNQESFREQAKTSVAQVMDLTKATASLWAQESPMSKLFEIEALKHTIST